MHRYWIAPLLLLLGCGPTPASISVFAAASLKEAVSGISAEWTKRTEQQVKLQFDASSTLARQIKEGAPADLFITAAPEWLDQVKTTERSDWLSNRLVVVIHRDTKEFDLARAQTLALPNDQVPAGKYAKSALGHLQMKPPGRTIYGSNVREVLTIVSEGGAEAGIVYATDAAIDPRVKIALTFPTESHPKILYSAGVLTPAGQNFYNALREPWAMEITAKFGFIPVH